MKSKTGVVAVTLAFIMLIFGAYFLYGQLTTGYDPSLVKESEQGEMESAVPQEEKDGNSENSSDNESNSATSDSSEEKEVQRIMAPDFTVYDLEGNAVNLSDFFGKPLIINFWASWCGPCQMEMPEFQNAYDEYGDKINFVVVNMTDGQRETVESASSFMEQSGYTFPVYYDTELDAAATYGVYSLPTTYFADSEGYLIAQVKRPLTAEMMAQGISMIYAE